MHKTLAGLALGASACAAAGASELVYYPVNPNFGGAPLNGNVLLGSAQATSKHQDPRSRDAGGAFGSQTPLKQFNDSLERSVLSQLASAATASVIVSGRIVPGRVETGNFTIDIADRGGGTLEITTVDKVTGASTSFMVNNP